MSASEALNTTQFPVEEVGNWHSGNVPGLTVAQEYDQMHASGAEQERAHYYGFKDSREYQQGLDEHVRQHGQRVPIRYSPADTPDMATKETLDKPLLENGFHRYATARNLGHTHIRAEPWTPGPNPRVSGWKGGR